MGEEGWHWGLETLLLLNEVTWGYFLGIGTEGACYVVSWVVIAWRSIGFCRVLSVFPLA